MVKNSRKAYVHRSYDIGFWYAIVCNMVAGSAFCTISVFEDEIIKNV